jgi:cbb3-type cytochrome oxidase subunit 3
MRWRGKPRTINEELLAQTAREAEVERDWEEAGGRLRRLAVYVLVGLLFVGLKEGVRFLPTWVGVIVGIIVVAHFVSIFVRSTSGGTPDRGRGLRTFFLVWLAICVVVTVLVALGGFQMEDRALLGFVWPLLGVIWVAYRLRRRGASPRSETGSESHP